MKYNKRGISAVVATVLIILITVAAVTIIWAAIIPLIQGQLDTTTSCLNAQTEITLESDFTCINRSSTHVTGIPTDKNFTNVQIKAGASSVSLYGVQVILYSGGDSKSILISNGSTKKNMPSPNSAIVYQINLSEAKANGALNLEASKMDRIQIAPIVKEENTEQTCPAGQILDLRAC